jgi:hypothetical protein
MTFNKEETVFGARQANKLNIGDLVSWTEWVWEQVDIWLEADVEPVATRQKKCFGVISELFIEDREVRKVAMAKVVPMNTKTEKRVYEKNMIATSLKLVSKGGMISGKANNRFISD